MLIRHANLLRNSNTGTDREGEGRLGSIHGYPRNLMNLKRVNERSLITASP